LEHTGTGPDQNSVFTFSNDGALRSLAFFILHTLRRLEERPLQANDEKAGRERPGEFWSLEWCIGDRF